MKPTFLYDELTAAVTSSQIAAASSAVQMVMAVSNNRIAIADVTVLENNAADSLFQLLILDVFGEPLLDVNGQYIIGG